MDQLRSANSRGLPDRVFSKGNHLLHSIKNNRMELEASMKRRKLSDDDVADAEVNKKNESCPARG